MNVDVLIVGAGPAGLSAAIKFASWCRSVTVVEAGEIGDMRRAGEHIPPAGISNVAAVGLGNLLADQRHGSSSGVTSVWGIDVAVEKEYFCSVQRRGINLRRALFDESLARAAREAGATLFFSTRLVSLCRKSQRYRATVRDTAGLKSIEAPILVDASGRRAIAAKALGLVPQRYDRLIGIGGRIESEPSEDPGRVYIESMEDGWWYGVELSQGEHLLTYMTDSTLLKRQPGGVRSLWQERLQNSHMLAPLRRGRQRGSLEVFDAASQQMVGPLDDESFLAVGDAAMAFDPISSWGITKALCDGYYGARAMERESKGMKGATAEYVIRRRKEFGHYMTKRANFYHAEGRWRESEFWQSRHGPQENRAG